MLEEDVRAAHARADAVFDSLPMAVMATNLQGVIQSGNRAAGVSGAPALSEKSAAPALRGRSRGLCRPVAARSRVPEAVTATIRIRPRERAVIDVTIAVLLDARNPRSARCCGSSGLMARSRARPCRCARRPGAGARHRSISRACADAAARPQCAENQPPDHFGRGAEHEMRRERGRVVLQRILRWGFGEADDRHAEFVGGNATAAPKGSPPPAATLGSCAVAAP